MTKDRDGAAADNSAVKGFPAGSSSEDVVDESLNNQAGNHWAVSEASKPPSSETGDSNTLGGEASDDQEGFEPDYGYQFLIERLKTQGLDDAVCVEIDKIQDLREKVIAILQTVQDPEIPVNIWELGLVYNLEIDENTQDIRVEMTLTAPACPIAEEIPKEVKERLEGMIKPEARGSVSVALVWDPPWNQEMMSEEARLIMNMF